MKRLLCLLLTVFLLCGCRASLLEGTEFTLRGVVTDTSYATVAEKPYGIFEKAYPQILMETEDGDTCVFFKMRGYDLATAFPGDTVEIRGGTDKRSGLTIAVEVTVLEKGKLHLQWDKDRRNHHEKTGCISCRTSVPAAGRLCADRGPGLQRSLHPCG